MPDAIPLDYFCLCDDADHRATYVAGVILFKEPPPTDRHEPFCCYPAKCLVEYPDSLRCIRHGAVIQWPDTKRRIPDDFLVEEPDGSGQTKWTNTKVFCVISPGKHYEDAVCETIAMNEVFRQLRQTAKIKSASAYLRMCEYYEGKIHSRAVIGCKQVDTARAAKLADAYINEGGQTPRHEIEGPLPFKEGEVVSIQRLWLADGRFNSEGSQDEAPMRSTDAQDIADQALVMDSDTPDLGNQLAESESLLAVRRREPPPVGESVDLFESAALNPDSSAMPPPPPPPVDRHERPPRMDISTEDEIPSPIRQASGTQAAASQPDSMTPTTSTQGFDASQIGKPLLAPKRADETPRGKGKGNKGKKKAGPASKTGRRDETQEKRKKSNVIESSSDEDDPYDRVLGKDRPIKRRRHGLSQIHEKDSDDSEIEATLNANEKERLTFPEAYYSIATAREKIKEAKTCQEGQLVGLGMQVRMHRDNLTRHRLAKKRDNALLKKIDKLEKENEEMRNMIKAFGIGESTKELVQSQNAREMAMVPWPDYGTMTAVLQSVEKRQAAYAFAFDSKMVPGKTSAFFCQVMCTHEMRCRLTPYNKTAKRLPNEHRGRLILGQVFYEPPAGFDDLYVEVVSKRFPSEAKDANQLRDKLVNSIKNFRDQQAIPEYKRVVIGHIQLAGDTIVAKALRLLLLDYEKKYTVIPDLFPVEGGRPANSEAVEEWYDNNVGLVYKTMRKHREQFEPQASYPALTAEDFPEDFLALDPKPVSGLVAKIKDPLDLRNTTNIMIAKAIEETKAHMTEDPDDPEEN